MAAIIGGRFCGAGLLKTGTRLALQQANQYSTAKTWSKGQKRFLASIGAIAGGAGALIFALEESIKGSGTEVHPYSHKWGHTGALNSLDHASVRRGYEVYKNVCAACHSLQYIAYRHLVGVTHTEDEAKAEAAGVQIKDGPDETGELFERPGKLADYFPSPYANEEAARHANNGAYPPDLSLIAYARHGGEDYIFALLTGYTETPAGVVLQEGQYFNPYFPGGAISMAQAIYNETVDYDDGTPASASQIAKDVSTFLKWTADIHHDDRKRLGIKIFMVGSVLLAGAWFLNRSKWTLIKSRKIIFAPKRK